MDFSVESGGSSIRTLLQHVKFSYGALVQWEFSNKIQSNFTSCQTLLVNFCNIYILIQQQVTKRHKPVLSLYRFGGWWFCVLVRKNDDLMMMRISWIQCASNSRFRCFLLTSCSAFAGVTVLGNKTQTTHRRAIYLPWFECMGLPRCILKNTVKSKERQTNATTIRVTIIRIWVSRANYIEKDEWWNRWTESMLGQRKQITR